MFVRRAAWQVLIAGGFVPILSGRQGTVNLAAGEDTELCLGLRLAGWHWWYEPSLGVQHYMPPTRLSWKYLCRIYRGIGVASVGLDPYEIAWIGGPDRCKGTLIKRPWQRQIIGTLLKLFHLRKKWLCSLRKPLEGDFDVLQLERSIGRLGELLRLRSAYDRTLENVWKAAWWEASRKSNR